MNIENLMQSAFGRAVQWLSAVPLSAAVIVASIPAGANADWSGGGELGLVFARGNTDTETLNGSLGLEYTREAWTNATSISFLRSETDGDVDASRFVATNDTQYALSPVSYIIGTARYDRDKFSSFEFQTSASIGYGRKVIDTERQTLALEFGPGVRYSEIRSTGETETDLIGRGSLDYRRTISETAEFTNTALVETGSSNTFLENEAALSVSINEALALKTAFSVRHNTDVEPGRDKTDYLTTLNLVYSFE
jgi:putative salt-induced outer membrane protein